MKTEIFTHVQNHLLLFNSVEHKRRFIFFSPLREVLKTQKSSWDSV